MTNWAAVVLIYLASVATESFARPIFKTGLLHDLPKPVEGTLNRYRHSVQILGAPGIPSADLEYDVEVAPNTVRLKFEETVERVDCAVDKLTIHLNSQPSPATSWSVNTILNGGSEWGCLDANGQPEIIMRRITAVDSVDLAAGILTFSTAPVGIADCFTTAEIKFNHKQSDGPQVNFPQSGNGDISNAAKIIVTDTAVPQQVHSIAKPTGSAEAPVVKVQGSVQIQSPRDGDSFTREDKIEVRWNGNPGSSTGTFYIMRERPVIWDAEVSKIKGVSLDSGVASIPVPAGSEDDGARFYIKMTWSGGSAESEKFSIPNMVFSSPTFRSTFNAGDTINVAWRWRSGGKPPSRFSKVDLMRYWPYRWDESIGASVKDVRNGNAMTFTLPPEAKGHMMPYYVRYSYDCNSIFSNWCSHAFSPKFTIPLKSVGEWNTGNDPAVPAQEQVLFQSTCQQQLTADQQCAPFSFPIMCEMCKRGYDVQFQVACSTCWIKYQYEGSLYMYKPGLAVERFEFKSNGAADLNMDLTAKITFRKTWEGTKALLSSLKVYGAAFDVGGFSVELGIFMDLNFKYSITLDGMGSVTIGSDGKVEWNTEASYDVRSEPKWVFGNDAPPNSVFNYHKPKINLQATLDVKLWLIPVLRFTALSVLTMSVTMEPYVQFIGKFQYPAFPPLAASGNVYGSCDRPHMVEAELYTGIDNFQFDLGISISLFPGNPLSWQKTLLIDSLSNKRLQLGTGCLVHPGITSSVGLEIDIPYSQFNLSDRRQQELLQRSLASDLADAMNIEGRRLVLKAVQPSGSNPGNTTIVVDIVSPSDAAAMQDQAESQSAAMNLLDMATNGDEVLDEGYVSKHITSATDLGTVDTDAASRPDPGIDSKWYWAFGGFGAGVVTTLAMIVTIGCVKRRRARKPKGWSSYHRLNG